MKAKCITAAGAGGERVILKDVLPLDTPLVLQIFPAYACNFKCNFCVFSTPEEKRQFISDVKLMDFDMYIRQVDEMKRFPRKIRVLRFAGMGEPLLHKNIIPMINYATMKGVAEKTELITNGSLLTPAMTDRFRLAGLSRMIISINGLTSEKYKEVCGKDIVFETILNNIKYFYKHKNNTHVHIKTVNTALDGKKDEKKFYKMFGNYCDSIGIENVMPLYPYVNFEGIVKSKHKTQYGTDTTEIKICPQPFATMQANPDGNVVACYSIVYPDIMGNCNDESIFDIWSGKRFNKFRHDMLKYTKQCCRLTCQRCTVVQSRAFPEDDLSEARERLLKVYENKTV